MFIYFRRFPVAVIYSCFLEVPKEKSHAKYLIFFHPGDSIIFIHENLAKIYHLVLTFITSRYFRIGFSQEVKFNAQMHSLGANLQLYANAQIESFIFGGAPVYIKGYVSRIYRSTCSLPTKVIIITSNVFLNVLFG